MKTIIAVRGPSNAGKSTSIKQACERLRLAYPDAPVENVREAITGRRANAPGDRTDVTIVITIDGAKVGIVSWGDPNDCLPDSLTHFVKVGCKVIVCATRTRGATVTAVEKLGPRYGILWLEKEKAVAGARTPANNEAADEIVSKVQAALAEDSRPDRLSAADRSRAVNVAPAA